MSAISLSSFAQFKLSELHIDIARNATDDFNLFHDKRRWQQIEKNPFSGPIALGFQLLQFVEHHCNCHRFDHYEHELVEQYSLDYSNYQFSFVNVVRPEQRVSLLVKPTKSKLQTDNPQITNRVIVKANDKIALIGFKSNSQSPLFGHSGQPTIDIQAVSLVDRTQIANTTLFYKRKYTTNSDAKNFLLSAGIDQSDYFDDLANVNRYSEMYCSGLLSCALLERAKSVQFNFLTNPMVYTQHKISVHSRNVSQLRSAQSLHYFIEAPLENDQTDHLNYHCWVLNQAFEPLIQAELSLAPLSTLLS